VAVAGAQGSVGVDGSGSIRNPSSYCGLVGLAPVWGRVSTADVLPQGYPTSNYGPSFNRKVGPITRSVVDAALLFSHMAGFDSRDMMTTPLQLGRGSYRRVRWKDRTVAYFWVDNGPMQPTSRIKSAVDKAAQSMTDLGATVVRKLPPYLGTVPYPGTLGNIVLASFVKGGKAEDWIKRLKEYGVDWKSDPHISTCIQLIREFGRRHSNRIDDWASEMPKLQHAIFEFMLNDVDLLLSPVTPFTAHGHRPEELWNLEDEKFRGTAYTVYSAICGHLPTGTIRIGSAGRADVPTEAYVSPTTSICSTDVAGISVCSG